MNELPRHLVRCVGLVLAFCVFQSVACNAPPTEKVLYHCPMHPTYISDRPGDCPICGMRLVPIEGKAAPSMPPAPVVNAAPAAGLEGLAEVSLEERGVRLANLQTAPAVRERLKSSVRAYGAVVVDETRVKHIHAKVSGFIEKLYVNTTGQPVQAGQPLLSLYSPELLASQGELLRAIDSAQRLGAGPSHEMQGGGADLVAAARRRLQLFDVPDVTIAEIERTRVASRIVELRAPVSGYVTVKQVYEGQQIDPTLELFMVTDLSRVWIEADIYEYEAREVRVGQEATFTLSYDPTVHLRGTVAYIYPFLNTDSRTLKVRFELDNRDLTLKPGMYVNVILEREAGEGVVIPESAVVDSGLRQVVFVEERAGHFVPRVVQLGSRGDGRVQVRAGVAVGERVVVKGNFLLDSESRLRAAISGDGAVRETLDGSTR